MRIIDLIDLPTTEAERRAREEQCEQNPWFADDSSIEWEQPGSRPLWKWLRKAKEQS